MILETKKMVQNAEQKVYGKRKVQNIWLKNHIIKQVITHL